MRRERVEPEAPKQGPEKKSEFSLIPQETLHALFADLVKSRMIEQRVRKRRVDAGWAAVQAAQAAVLKDAREEDLVVASQDTASLRYLRGEKPSAALRGDRKPAAEPAPKLLHAIGAALANKTSRNENAVFVFWSNAEDAAWRDALEIARVHSLPILFVAPLAKSELTKVTQPGTELPRISVDGYDAVAVYRVAHEAIGRARRHRGPTLIECTSVRLDGRRSAREENAVASMQRYLQGKNLYHRGMRQEIEEAFRRELSKGKWPSRAK